MYEGLIGYQREAEVTPLPKLSAPAQRALTSAGIGCLEDVAKFSKDEILNLHGIGKATIIPLDTALIEARLGFKGDQR